MTVKCPQCGRPNSEEITACIYCGAELLRAERPAKPAAKEPAPPPLTPTKPQAVSRERIFVVIPPFAEEPGEEMVAALSRLVNWDEYLSRLKLRSRVPWILAGFDDDRRVQEMVRELAGAGIDSYLIKENGLARLENKLTALSASADGTAIRFKLIDDAERSLNFADLFLLVRGRVRLAGDLLKKAGKVELPDLEIEAGNFFDLLVKSRRERARKKLLIGDLQKGESSTEVELFDLYAQNDFTAVRVIESEFAFAGLFGGESQGQLVGMRKLTDWLRAKAPQLIVDESFTRVAYTYREKPVDKPTTSRFPSTGPGKSREKLHSSQALFTAHSGLIYLDYLRQKKGRRLAPAL